MLSRKGNLGYYFILFFLETQHVRFFLMQATNTRYINTETGTFILFKQTKITKNPTPMYKKTPLNNETNFDNPDLVPLDFLKLRAPFCLSPDIGLWKNCSINNIISTNSLDFTSYLTLCSWNFLSAFYISLGVLFSVATKV